ncbi:uncharacterized protein TNCV_2687531 [Trichonephila clavipes]|nr:uncharacterized protein TNCV_2687531 [Trichonephila clavipes]
MKSWILHVVGTVQEHGGSIMICFFRGPVWDLWCAYQPTSIRYVELLGDHIRPFMLLCYPHVIIFSSKTTVPLTSAVWLLAGVKGHHAAPTKLTELWTALANIWRVIPVERFQKLVESMSRRVAAVIKARGGPPRY